MAVELKDSSAEAAEESLLALLTGDNSDDTGPDDEIEEADDAEEEQDDVEEQDEDIGDDSDEPEGSDDEGASDEEDSDEEEEQKGAAPKVVPADAVAFTVSDGDKNVPVTAGEAKAGYLRQSDYSRKTEELGKERTAIQTERTQLDVALKQVLSLMEGEDADSTPLKLAELARTDPEAATRLRFEREARAEQRSQVEAARAELAKRTDKEQLDEAKKVQAVEFAKLLEVMPDLTDVEKAKGVLTRLTKAAVAVGFQEADMNRITDHRLMRLLDLAATGLRLSAKKVPAPDPKGTRVAAVAPGVKARGISGRDKAARDARFQKSRSPEDATDSLMAAMDAASKKRR